MKTTGTANGKRGVSAPMLLAILAGLLMGVGIYTFVYARGASYLTDNPAACANCHVMREQFESWMKGSHRKAAVCNDCHTPAGLVPKYSTKALNGFFHSWAFTSGWYPDDIQITPRNYRVANDACMKCHEQITSGIRSNRKHREDVQCITCHRQAGHI